MEIRPLSSALQQKAKNELNEVPSRIPEDLKHIKEWLFKQPHLNVRTDDQWLLAFLRGCKFSLERTKEKLDAYYTIKSMVPEVFSNRDPLLPEIQEFLKHGILTVLPKSSDPAGYKVVFVIAKLANPNQVTIESILKVIGIVTEILMIEDDNFTIAGGHLIIDMQDIPYKYLTQMTPSFLKKIAIMLQKANPARLKGIHCVNMPLIWYTTYNTFKSFLPKKLSNKIAVYTAKNIDDLYKIIPLHLLPKDYGGEVHSIRELTAEWKLKIESYHDWFLEDVAYGSDETKRPGKAITSADLFGIEGSFRKLNID